MQQLFESFREVVDYRDMLVSLALRDIRIRYKQSLLGFAWAVFTPLSTVLIFTLFTKAKILSIDTGGVPYVIFAYCGILPWTFFSSTLTTATSCLVANRTLVTKVYFPKEVFPLSNIMSKLVDFFIAATILLCLMAYYRVPIRPTLLAFPVIFILQLLFMIGMSFLLSMGNLFYRDVKYVFDSLIILWMFATSVIYPIKFSSPLLQTLFMLNPMTPIIDAYRQIIIHGRMPDITGLCIALPVILTCFFAGIFFFHRSSYKFAERI